MFQKKWRTISLIVIALVASTVALVEYRRIYILNDRLGCVVSWLDQAKTLHAVEMKQPANFTGDTMQKLMETVDRAYDCATKEPTLGGAPGGGAFGEHGDILQHQGTK